MPTSVPLARAGRAAAALRSVRDVLVSLEFTVVLLVLGMVLVFAGTLDQVNLGIWAAQAKYFRSFVIYTRVGELSLPIFPGGYTIGGLLLANLVAAHVYRFAFRWRKLGILLTHLGLIVLLVGELLTGLWQEDYHLRLDQGETTSYAESHHFNELAIIDATDAKFDDVVAIPEALLARKTPIQHPKLPFRIVAKTHYPNSTLHVRAAAEPPAEATAGFGERITATPAPITYRQKERNMPTAIIELAGADGPIGTYLVSTQLVQPQEFEHAGRTWRIALRFKRRYQPFSLTLLEFRHERYAGTEIPKSFSSRLRLKTPDGRDDREVLISMNNPLRHAGLTFYQSGFDNNDRTTILQVVRNPSWLLPYLACTLMTIGLTVQFTIHLVAFIGKRRRTVERATPAALPAGLPTPAR